MDKAGRTKEVLPEWALLGKVNISAELSKVVVSKGDILQ